MQLPPTIAEPPPLDAIEAHVWSVAIDAWRDRYSGFESLLRPAEAQRAASFRFAEPRERFVITRGALRILLSHYLARPAKDIEFSYGGSGKPNAHGIAAQCELQFNVSHSGDRALIAVTSGCEIGVDIERIREIRHWQAIAKRYFHPEEIRDIMAASHHGPEAFFRCWTNKEALLKAVGAGVMGPLNAFRVPVVASEPAWVALPESTWSSAKRCWLAPLDAGRGYAAAVALVDCQRRVRPFEFTPASPDASKQMV